MPKQIILSDELVSVLKSIDHRFSTILIDSHENKEEVVDNSYIAFSKEEGEVSYLPVKRENSKNGKELTESDKWLTGRQSMSIGKWVRAILQIKGVQYKEFELEEFVNQYKYQQFDFNFILVKGQDIVKWYKEKNYDNRYGSGSLFNSCMRAVSSDYFKIYRDNENVSMLCLINKETKKLIGRAIVWDKTSINGEDSVFLDRIYTTKSLFESAVKNYCKSRGWYFKNNQGSGNVSISNGKKTIENPNIIFHLNEKINWENCPKMPYIDTMSFFGYISNNDKCLPVLTSYNKCNFKFNFKGTDGNIYDNVNYDSRRDLLNRRLTVGDLILIKYDNGYAWIDDTDYGRVYQENFIFNIKLIKGSDELITVKGVKKNLKSKFNHSDTNIISHIGDVVPTEYHVYLFDLFKDDLIFEVDNTYQYLKQYTQFKLYSICSEHFKMVLDEAPQTVISSDITQLSKELLNIILEKNPEIIFNIDIQKFIRTQHLFEETVIQKYIIKYPDLSLIEGKIAIKVSKKIIEKICKSNMYKVTKNEIENKYGVSKCFLTDSGDDDIYIQAEPYWFTCLSLKTKVKRLRELSKIEKLIKFITKDKSIPYDYGEVIGVNDGYRRDSIRVKFKNGDVYCSVKELTILERDLKENFYQYLNTQSHYDMF